MQRSRISNNSTQVTTGNRLHRRAGPERQAARRKALKLYGIDEERLPGRCRDVRPGPRHAQPRSSPAPAFDGRRVHAARCLVQQVTMDGRSDRRHTIASHDYNCGETSKSGWRIASASVEGRARLPGRRGQTGVQADEGHGTELDRDCWTALTVAEGASSAPRCARWSTRANAKGIAAVLDQQFAVGQADPGRRPDADPASPRSSIGAADKTRSRGDPARQGFIERACNALPAESEGHAAS